MLPLRGEADASLYEYEHQEIAAIDFGMLIRAMRSAGVTQVVLAGGLRNRPHLSDLKLNLPTIRAVRYVLTALGQGDDALLRAFMRLLERYGFKMVGAHEVVPDLLSPTPPRAITRLTPDSANAGTFCSLWKLRFVLANGCRAGCNCCRWPCCGA